MPNVSVGVIVEIVGPKCQRSNKSNPTSSFLPWISTTGFERDSKTKGFIRYTRRQTWCHATALQQILSWRLKWFHFIISFAAVVWAAVEVYWPILKAVCNIISHMYPTNWQSVWSFDWCFSGLTGVQVQQVVSRLLVQSNFPVAGIAVTRIPHWLPTRLIPTSHWCCYYACQSFPFRAATAGLPLKNVKVKFETCILDFRQKLLLICGWLKLLFTIIFV